MKTTLCGCLVLIAMASSPLAAQQTDNQWPVAESINSIQREEEPIETSSVMDIDLSLTIEGAVPSLEPIPQADGEFRAMACKTVEFTSDNFRYRRLLFEQPLLERHGITRHEKLQPLVSCAHFFGSTVLFPFELVTGHQRLCDNSLGWGTPGSRRLNCQR